MKRLEADFFSRDVLVVAPELLGKFLVQIREDGSKARYAITEVEAYRGEEDLACHASKGRTRRTEIMYAAGGHLYVYLIYGMYWMVNIVTGQKGIPQAVLIRGLQGISGPGRVSMELMLDGSWNGFNLVGSDRLWLEDSGRMPEYITTTRIGIDYAGDFWKSKPWRFVTKPASRI
jgi:DNA-3-methyladenine glycosylase